MISQTDIDDWVHVGENLVQELKKTTADEGNLFSNTKLCHDAAAYIDKLMKVFKVKE